MNRIDELEQEIKSKTEELARLKKQELDKYWKKGEDYYYVHTAASSSQQSTIIFVNGSKINSNYELKANAFLNMFKNKKDAEITAALVADLFNQLANHVNNAGNLKHVRVMALNTEEGESKLNKLKNGTYKNRYDRKDLVWN